jgi:hypothetical protein
LKARGYIKEEVSGPLNFYEQEAGLKSHPAANGVCFLWKKHI